MPAGNGIVLANVRESLSPFQNALYISFSVQNGNNLNGRGPWPIHNGVVGITGERPETQQTACQVGARMAAHGSLRGKRTGFVDRLFDPVGSFLAVVGDVGPDIEDVGFSERRESVNAHRLGARA